MVQCPHRELLRNRDCRSRSSGTCTQHKYANAKGDAGTLDAFSQMRASIPTGLITVKSFPHAAAALLSTATDFNACRSCLYPLGGVPLGHSTAVYFHASQPTVTICSQRNKQYVPLILRAWTPTRLSYAFIGACPGRGHIFRLSDCTPKTKRPRHTPGKAFTLPWWEGLLLHDKHMCGRNGG